MPDLKTIQDGVRDRLAELEQLIEPLRREADQLREVAAGFGPESAPAPKRARARTRPASKPAAESTNGAAEGPPPKRGRPLGSGNRAQQALSTIRDRPGITAPELAASMGIGPNYLYRVLPRLEREGRLTKRGRGYHLADQPAPTPEVEAPETGVEAA